MMTLHMITPSYLLHSCSPIQCHIFGMPDMPSDVLPPRALCNVWSVTESPLPMAPSLSVVARMSVDPSCSSYCHVTGCLTTSSSVEGQEHIGHLHRARSHAKRKERAVHRMQRIKQMIRSADNSAGVLPVIAKHPCCPASRRMS